MARRSAGAFRIDLSWFVSDGPEVSSLNAGQPSRIRITIFVDCVDYAARLVVSKGYQIEPRHRHVATCCLFKWVGTTARRFTQRYLPVCLRRVSFVHRWTEVLFISAHIRLSTEQFATIAE